VFYIMGLGASGRDSSTIAVPGPRALRADSSVVVMASGARAAVVVVVVGMAAAVVVVPPWWWWWSPASGKEGPSTGVPGHRADMARSSAEKADTGARAGVVVVVVVVAASGKEGPTTAVPGYRANMLALYRAGLVSVVVMASGARAAVMVVTVAPVRTVVVLAAWAGGSGGWGRKVL